MSSVRMQEINHCVGFRKQSAIATANIAADMWRFPKLNATLFNPRPVYESDADEYGKGNEFVANNYLTSWDVNGTLEHYLSSEMAAWAFCFGLGKVVKSGTTPANVYTVTTPFGSAGDSVELPAFSICEQIRIGAQTVVLDRILIGCAINSFMITLGTGPGRANSKISVDVIGSGKYTAPSTITMPSAMAPHLLPAASMAVTINAVDYVTSKNLVSLDMGWNNNIVDSGFYPGSDFQTPGNGSTGAIRGRHEFGKRVGTLRFVARYDKDSLELTKLLQQTTGTAVVTLDGGTNEDFTATWAKVAFSVVEVGETDGLVTVAVECTPMYSSGVLSVVAHCSTDNICQAPA